MVIQFHEGKINRFWSQKQKWSPIKVVFANTDDTETVSNN